jgi:hypothetical protein
MADSIAECGDRYQGSPAVRRGGNRLNWEAIGAVAEGLGAIGVIASLLYLATQVRNNTRASRVEAKLAATNYLSSYTDHFINSPEIKDLFLRGRRSIADLDQVEYYRFGDLCIKAFWYFSAVHFQLRSGMLTGDEWQETRAVIHYYLRGPGVRAWWAKGGGAMFGSDFSDFVDAEIRELTAT